MKISEEILSYNNALPDQYKAIADKLSEQITNALPDAENKLWHGHPVWFLNGNPITGYSKLKDSLRLLFWSGQSFDEEKLAKEGKFMAAEIRYTNPGEIEKADLERWLKKSRDIQWDYKNIVKRKGILERLV